MTRDEFAKQFIEQAASRGASKEDVAKVLPQALDDFDKQNPTKQTNPVDIAKNLGLGAANFIAPRTTKLVGDVIQDVKTGNMPTQTPQNVLSSGLGPLGVILGGSPIQKQAGAAGAELASYGLGAKGLTQIPALGAYIGATGQAVSPEEQSLVSRAGKTAVGGGVGLATGWLMQKALGFLSGEGIKKTGKGLVASQYEVPRAKAGQLKLDETVGKLSDYGITNIDDVIPASEKANTTISKVVRESVATAKKPVDTTGLWDVAKQITDDPSIPIGQDKKILNYFKEHIQNLYPTTGKGPALTADPMETFDFMKTLERKASETLNKGVVTEDGRALASAYWAMADELKDRLFSNVGAGADEAATNLIKSPEVVKQLTEISPKLAVAAQKIKTVSELRHLLEPFVKGSKLVQITEAGAQSPFKAMMSGDKGLGRVIPSIQDPLKPLRLLLSSNQLNAGVGGVLQGVGNVTSKLQQGATNISPALLQLLNAQMSRTQ